MSLDRWVKSLKSPREKGEGGYVSVAGKRSEEPVNVEEPREARGPPIGTTAYILLSADYDPDLEKVCLKFYDTSKHEILIWYDNTGHRPYAYSRMPVQQLKTHPEILRLSDRILDIREEEKIDPLTDAKIVVSKIIAKDPLVIGGTRASLRERIPLWEADIKYYANYIFDSKLQVGAYYYFDEKGTLRECEVPLPDEVKKLLGGFSDDVIKWVKLLSMEIPNYKRVAFDVEVYNPPGIMPQAEEPKYPIFIVSLRGSDGLRKVLVYDLRQELSNEEITYVDGYEVEVFRNERDLINRALEIAKKYPILVTFNGDNFDLPYLRRRAETLGIQDVDNYIKLGRNDARITWGIHLDLYPFFKNVSVKNYAFSGAYDIVSLDSVARALLGKGKVQLEKPFQELKMEEIIRYAYMDAELTYELTTFDDNLVMKLITLIGRISNMIIDDVCRLSISNWIRNRLLYEHRNRGYLIVDPEDISKKGGKRHLEPVTKGKKYAGALVIEPKPGIHFNVYVLDFASLYPSIIKEYNISYETVNCPHEGCRGNQLFGLTTWICKEKRGLISEFTGIIRDIRVFIFKKLAKDPSLPIEKRKFYEAAQGAIKVFLNAMYGVTGADTFQFYYLPAAEAVTYLGRLAISKSIKIAKEEGLEVIYGDTDSLFIKNPDPNRLSKFISRVETETKLKVEMDKVYKYVVFSERKKNYFGVLKEGTIDVKGLLGKKSSTPPFIKEVFYTILDILKTVNSQEEFDNAKKLIKDIVAEAERKLRMNEVPLELLAISVTISKPTNKYTKTTPQHVKAARKLEKALGITIPAGSIIRIVKTKGEGAEPLELVKSYRTIDVDKYVELLRSTLSQILEALELELSVKEVKKGYEYKSLDQFFKM